MKDNEILSNAIQELDAFTKEGIFGEKSQELLSERDSIPADEFMFHAIMSIYEDPDFDLGMHQFTITFMNLFVEAMLVDADKLKDIIKASMVGEDEHPELETMSSYTRYMLSKKGQEQLLDELERGTEGSALRRLNFANGILRNYSEGFEYVMKLFTFILGIEQLINDKKVDLSLISRQNAGNKLNSFRQLDIEKKYTLLTDSWDARLRNADSHLDIRYDTQKHIFEGKNHIKQTNNGIRENRVETFTITPEELLIDITPNIGRFIQGYLSATYMLFLSKEGRGYYNQVADYWDSKGL